MIAACGIGAYNCAVLVLAGMFMPVVKREARRGGLGNRIAANVRCPRNGKQAPFLVGDGNLPTSPL